MLQFQFGFWIGHVVVIGLIKLVLLFFFRRIFRGKFDVVSICSGESLPLDPD